MEIYDQDRASTPKPTVNNKHLNEQLANPSQIPELSDEAEAFRREVDSLQVPPPNSNSDLNSSPTNLSEKAAGKKKKKDSEHERSSHWLVSKEAIEADKMRVSKHFVEEQRQFEAWARMQTRGVEEYLNSIPEDQIDLRSQLTESLERLKGVNAILYQQLVSMENDSNH